jgi:hypothetical protein
MRRRRDDDDDVVRDGERVRVPMMFRDEDGLPGRVFLDEDGVRTAAADWQIDYVRDCAFAHSIGLEDAEALRRPGFRFCDAAGVEAKAKAYLQAVQDAEAAWRHPRDAYGAYPAGAGAEEGGACTVDGAPGKFRRQSDGTFVCVPDESEDGRSRMDARDEAYVAMCRELSDAWKGK